MIEEGEVEITNPESDRSVVVLEAGAIFGEDPLLGQSLFGMRALSKGAKVYFLYPKQVAELIKLDAANILDKLGRKLVEAQRERVRAAFQTVTAKVAAFLLENSHWNGEGRAIIGYTHQQIADAIGVYRETVTNSISELKRKKLVSTSRKKIDILAGAEAVLETIASL